MAHTRHIAPSTGPATPTARPTLAQDPARQAFLVLRSAFTLCDFGLLLGVVGLWRLAGVYDARPLLRSHSTA
jgi:hypothetical protein